MTVSEEGSVWAGMEGHPSCLR